MNLVLEPGSYNKQWISERPYPREAGCSYIYSTDSCSNFAARNDPGPLHHYKQLRYETRAEEAITRSYACRSYRYKGGEDSSRSARGKRNPHISTFCINISSQMCNARSNTGEPKKIIVVRKTGDCTGQVRLIIL